MLSKFWGKRGGKSVPAKALVRSTVQVEELEKRQHLALTATGIDPNNMGKGDFIWQIPTAMKNVGATSEQEFAKVLKSAGFKWVIVKAGDGNDGPLLDYNDGKGTPTVGGWTQFSREFIDTLHNEGIKVFGYQFVYGGGTVSGRSTSTFTSPELEKKVAKDILSLGADGLVIDAEGQFEAVANNAAIAEDYCKSVRDAYPGTFIALSSFPYISLHPKVPWETYSKYVDVHMPQAYWVTITRAQNSPEKMIADMDKEWKTLYDGFRAKGHPEYARPIVPTGQGYNTGSEKTTSNMINRWYATLKNDAATASPGGYNGTSFWSLQSHTPDIWKGIVNNDIGNPGGLVTGKIFNDFNGDGAQARNGEPGALGWTVYDDANKNGQLDSTEVRTVADINGNFKLFWLPAGDHVIRQVSPSTAWRQTTQDSYTVTVLDNQESLAGSFGVTNNPQLRGTVYNDSNVDGSRGSNETGVKGALVWVDLDRDGQLDPKEPTTRTNRSGGYSFTLGVGEYQIRQIPPKGYRPVAPGKGYRNITLNKRGATFTGQNFGATSLALIKGVVFQDTNRDGLRRGAESGLADVTVYLDTNKNGILDSGEKSTTTSSSGIYRFDVAAGTYVVRPVITNRSITSPKDGLYALTMKRGMSSSKVDFGLSAAKTA
ncbi:MAG TPA: SdrD B-like domain-containing protein [Tepidisphaeraceae bacterium]|jgi:hypothetical protein